MSVLQLPDLRNGYVELASWIIDRGQPVTSRGLPTVELTGVTLEFPDPTSVMLPLGVNRRVNARLAAVETLQLLSGTTDAALIRRAAPTYADVLVDPSSVEYGAYGPRLHDQLDAVIELLHRDRYTRRAVLSIWREGDLTHDGDQPCTLSLQVLVRPDATGDDALELVVTMRSQDVWLGVPYDGFMFSQLQRALAFELGVRVGRYVHHVGSLHLYDRDREAAGMLTRCSDDRPVPVDYPAGVRTPYDADYFTETAARLLDGSADEYVTSYNPWYVRQLAQLGVTRLTGVEVDR